MDEGVREIDEAPTNQDNENSIVSSIVEHSWHWQVKLDLFCYSLNCFIIHQNVSFNYLNSYNFTLLLFIAFNFNFLKLIFFKIIYYSKLLLIHFF